MGFFEKLEKFSQDRKDKLKKQELERKKKLLDRNRKIYWLGKNIDYLHHMKGIPELETNEMINYLINYEKITINNQIVIPMIRIKKARCFQKTEGSYRTSPTFILTFDYISLEGKMKNAQFKYSGDIFHKYLFDMAEFINETVGYVSGSEPHEI